ncbi:hypothetical protein [Streptomyces sp. MAI_2237]
MSGADPRKEIRAYPCNGREGGDAVRVRRRLDWPAALPEVSPSRR